MSESVEELQKKLNESRETPEGYARTLRIELASIVWRRMLELDWDMLELGRRSGWEEDRLHKLIRAEGDFDVDSIGAIMHTMGLQVIFATRELPLKQAPPDGEPKK